MYKMHSNLHQRFGSTSSGRRQVGRSRCPHSAVIVALTIIITGLIAYLITVIAGQHQRLTSSPERFTLPDGGLGPVKFEDFETDEEQQTGDQTPAIGRSKRRATPRRNSHQADKHPVEPLSLASSELVATRLRPAGHRSDNELHTSQNLARLKQKLAHLNRADLLKLLQLVQEKIELRRSSIKRRQAEPAGSETSPMTISSAGNKSESQLSSEEPRQLNGTQNTQAKSTGAAASDEPVVKRSRKLKQLMSHMDRIEAMMPTAATMKGRVTSAAPMPKAATASAEAAMIDPT